MEDCRVVSTPFCEQIYCDSCYLDLFTHCENCDGEVLVDESRYFRGCAYCTECFDENYRDCSCCGETCHIDELNENEDGDYCCSDCYDCDSWHSGDDIIGHVFSELKSARRYGIELEYSDCPDYTSLRNKVVYGAKNDGTSGVEKEFVSPILQGDEGLQVTRNFLKRTRRFKVSKACGYHLHIDCTSDKVAQLRAIAMAYHYTYTIWKQFVPDDRRNNCYCRAYRYDPVDIINDDFLDLIDMPESRYIWANWESYKLHKTLEIRLHTGTNDQEKVINWVKAHLRFVDYVIGYTAMELHDLFKNADENELFQFMVTAWNDDKLADYFCDRSAKFGGSLEYVKNADNSDSDSDILHTATD
jgi:hypothetical protein